MISGSEDSLVSLQRVDVWLPPGIIQYQVAYLDTETDCVKGQWFSEVLYCKVTIYIYVSQKDDGFFSSAAWGLKDHVDSTVFFYLALYALSEFFESFHNIMHYRCWKI